MRRRRRTRLAVLLAASALLLGACGDSSSPSASRGGPKTIPGAGGDAHGHAGRGGGGTGAGAIGGGKGAAGGGGGAAAGVGSASQLPATATRPTFIRSADGVCRQAHTGLARLSRELRAFIVDSARRKQLSTRAFTERVARLTQRSADLGAREMTDLRGLARPRDVRVDAFLAIGDAQARARAAQAVAIRHRDARAVAKLNAQIGAGWRRGQQLARTYGFRVCFR